MKNYFSVAKTILFSFLVASVALSCSKDDDDEQTKGDPNSIPVEGQVIKYGDLYINFSGDTFNAYAPKNDTGGFYIWHNIQVLDTANTIDIYIRNTVTPLADKYTFEDLVDEDADANNNCKENSHKYSSISYVISDTVINNLSFKKVVFNCVRTTGATEMFEYYYIQNPTSKVVYCLFFTVSVEDRWTLARKILSTVKWN